MNFARSGSPGMRTTLATSSLLQRMHAEMVSNMDVVPFLYGAKPKASPPLLFPVSYANSALRLST